MSSKNGNGKANTDGATITKEQAAILMTAVIEAPGDAFDSGYARDRVEVVSLTGEQADALKRLTCSLRAKNARCTRRDARTPDGRVVDNEADAVRWLLDRLANEYAR